MPDVKVYPATTERWNDLETLFVPKGAYAGCWCMFWRLDRVDFKRMKGEGTKAVLKDTTDKDEVAGLLAYQEEQPIGWCSIGPWEGYPIDLQTDKLAGQTLGIYAGYLGIASVYRDAGFVRAADASETQRIMRYTLDNAD